MYNGDPTLRGPGEKVAMPPKLLAEYIKCKEDVMYFAEKYFYIIDVDKGRMRIPLRYYQKKILKAFIKPTKKRKHVIMLSARQSGKTTIAALYILHYALFNRDKTIAILANKEKTAHEILLRIKTAFQELPLWLQQGIEEQYGGWAKGSIGFENHVRIISGSTAGSAMRTYSINLLYLDEFAFVPQNIADNFMRSVYPTISSGKTTKIIIVSTPNGLNQFYHIWRAAVRNENNFMPIKINWDEIPGRDAKWKQEQINDFGPQAFAQEYACKFLGSTNTLIDSDLLERMQMKDPKTLKLGSFLTIYEEPKEGEMYMLGVDSAKGTGKDYSVIQVLKISSENDIEQVAVYRNNLIEPHDFAQIVISVSKYYNDCYMMVENNDVGGTVAESIWFEFEYDKIILCDKKGIGIRSTRKSKLAANILLKRYIENGWLEIIDRNTIYELSRYEEVTPNVFKAPRGGNDDCVMALIWGLYFVSTVHFDGKNTNIKKIDKKFLIDESKQEDDAPVMFFDDGSTPDSINEEDLDEGWGYDEGLKQDDDPM